ncbi:Glutamyl aminopeptidase [Dufourea novaeangliae]|uniref:Aminopeptidase n=2 Tax=Dufourea novaeangliae TaxID=178035 RepID=A0A154NWD9_DUFNO|nr:Glutamyl aminopeptidase [Dufourea novaeangliae]
MKPKDFRETNGEPSKNNLAQYRNGSMDIDKRLSEDVVPSNYVIAISPDFRKDEFHGSVRIDIEVLYARSHIVLHSSNLTILSTKLYSQRSKTEIPIKSVSPVDKHGMLVIETFRVISAAEYFLRMNFTGSLKGKVYGFYLSKYTDLNESVRKLAVTQFEPFYARNAFPCFDEPSFKSTFHIRLLYTEKPFYHALSNMPVTKSETIKDDKSSTVTFFDPSPPMSTYLVAFIVSDFECLESTLTILNGSNIPVNVCVRPMYKNKTRFALDTAVQVMEYYLTIFGVDYPLPKLDLIGVPDFNAGAMENWGLITFRETELLHNGNDSSYLNTRSVSWTVAHELAHMWFGNLVTMRWWNDLWLNEGFATYMEHMAIDFVFPEWNLIDSFPLHTKYVAMRHDGKTRARPIVKRVEDPEEIEEMFDRLSYHKAAAVIRMLEDAIGNTKFVRGVRDYLTRYQFRNADSRDLFEVLRNSSNIDIGDFMSRWTKTPGFPMIDVRRDNVVFRLSQRRFAVSKKFHETLDDGSWTIPVKYITSRRDGVKFDWFLGNFSCVELTLEKKVDWIKLNHRSIGYYIVNYTEDAWNTFSNLLKSDHQVLSPIDRADLLHDAFLLADAADLNYSAVMNLTVYLVNETHYQPWAVASDWFGQMNRLLGKTRVHARFQSYARNLVEKIYHRVGWRVVVEKSFVNRELGVLILHAACSVGQKHCLETARRKLMNFLENNAAEPLPADIRSIVYTFGLATQTSDVGSIFESMSRLLARETNVQERDRLMIGLAGVQDKGILNRYLRQATNETFIRKQDFAQLLIKMASTPVGLDVVWNFVRSQWDSLAKMYTANGYTLGNAIVMIVSLFKDHEMLHEARRFFLRHPDLGVTESAKRNAIEEIENNINWLKTNMQNIERWLTTNGFD